MKFYIYDIDYVILLKTVRFERFAVVWTIVKRSKQTAKGRSVVPIHATGAIEQFILK